MGGGGGGSLGQAEVFALANVSLPAIKRAGAGSVCVCVRSSSSGHLGCEGPRPTFH